MSTNKTAPTNNINTIKVETEDDKTIITIDENNETINLRKSLTKADINNAKIVEEKIRELEFSDDMQNIIVFVNGKSSASCQLVGKKEKKHLVVNVTEYTAWQELTEGKNYWDDLQD